MKIGIKEEDFTPITITLETQDEVNSLYDFGNYGDSVLKTLQSMPYTSLYGNSHKTILYDFFDKLRDYKTRG